jgi:pimeloyl-ACP methyl ester carboxylesterase
MSAGAQSSSKKRGCLKWGGVALGALALLLIVVLAIVAFQGSRAQAALRAQYPPPGQMVDVGGYKMHIYCQGSGSPTVILVAGFGGFSLDWSLVQPEVAQTTRVCAYDMAGFGWSERGPNEPTLDNILTELHTLLANADIEGPYVLVGHSIGGPYVRAYAFRHPDEVVGLVLVDDAGDDQVERVTAALASHENEGGGTNMNDQINMLMEQVILRVLDGLDTLGILAMNPEAFPGALPPLPEEVLKVYKGVALSSGSFIATYREAGGYMEDNMAEVRAMDITLGDTPLVVLSAQKWVLPPSFGLSAEEMAEIWAEIHGELASLSSRGKVVPAEESSHFIQCLQPELVIDAIREVVEETRGTGSSS